MIAPGYTEVRRCFREYKMCDGEINCYFYCDSTQELRDYVVKKKNHET